MLIRPETSADFEAIGHVETVALGAGEAKLVVALRASGKAILSLVAELNSQIVGHIFFSPVVIETASGPFQAIGLGPMAVLPDFQKRGIGSALVRAGLEELRQSGQPAIVVLGHAEFYARFGFRPAHHFGIKCLYDVPPEAFMAVELAPSVLADKSGTVIYAPEFNDL